MKMYKKKEQDNVSWSIAKQQDGNDIIINAVDSSTGNHICNLIIFKQDGKVVTVISARDCLIKQGYDKYEHQNDWNDDGSIKITMEEQL